jgi:hypothetical protein
MLDMSVDCAAVQREIQANEAGTLVFSGTAHSSIEGNLNKRA